jgi:anaerobic selenocysteine-containing dehydrogenase
MRKVVKTACSRDCPDACSIAVTVEDGRAIRLQGDKEDPITRGFLCERTSRFLDRQYAADRFLSPMLRRHGALVPIGWDEALDLAAEKLLAAKREHGPASIFHYRSGGSLGILKLISDVMFAELGPVSVKRGDICSGAGDAAQEADFGVNESHDLFDLLESKLIVLWGKNPHVSGVHLLPILKEAKARGAKIAGIDPVRTRAASISDVFLTPRPGADYAAAMAVARHLFESGATDPEASAYCDNVERFRALAFERSFAGWAELADVRQEELAAFAELYASTKPAAILVGWGMGRRRNGSRTVRAIDALAAISGNLGVPGGGSSFYFGRRRAFDTDFGFASKEPPRTFPEARLGPELLAANDPEVRVAWITAGNPVSMLPESESVRSALEKIDFTVVVETHPTDTTDVADLVLPTLTLIEDSDLLGAYGNHWIRASEPAIDPPGQARHELHIWQGLAERLGIGEVMAGSIESWKRRAMRRLEGEGITIDELRRGVRNPFAAKVLFEGRRFFTPNGKAQLLDTAAGPPPATSDAFPMTLLAVSTPKGQSSQWSMPIPSNPPEVFVHPSRAAGRSDGAEAWLESELGRVRVTVRIDPEARPDVARMDKGGMLRDRRCANALVRAEESDFGGGAAYYDQPVRLV